eukprot:8635-Heterococcus_DN1.PRE.1
MAGHEIATHAWCHAKTLKLCGSSKLSHYVYVQEVALAQCDVLCALSHQTNSRSSNARIQSSLITDATMHSLHSPCTQRHQVNLNAVCHVLQTCAAQRAWQE